MEQGEKYAQENDIRNHKERVERWEKEFPIDYKEIVRNRLQEFLKLTADIDYNAALKDVNGKKKFVNPNYERKSSQWKMAFRAGKEVTEPARAFVQQWLKEL